MIEPHWILSFLLLGSVVGFMAGLLGIGGGGIMVPVLSTLYVYHAMPLEKVVHMALGTSMASIVITSFSSLLSHHKKNGVQWPIVKMMSPGVIVGTFLATFLAAYASALHLSVFFAAFMAFVAVQMFINKKPQSNRTLSGPMGLMSSGAVIGAVSALVSIGGGSLTVPYLCWQNIDIKKAIGTSAALGLPLSVAGTIGYVVNGWSFTNDIQYTLGYVYVPAVVLISLTSFFTAPLGVKLVHKLPVVTIKKIFAILLILLSLKMLSSTL